MKKLGCSIRAIAIVAIATVAGSGGLWGSATPSPVAAENNSSSPLHPSSLSQASQRLAQRNDWSDCRKVGENYTQFYTIFPGTGGLGTAILNSGDRVRLLDNGQTYQGSDGRFYYRISSPYASQNPTIGYISVNASLNRCGHSARW